MSGLVSPRDVRCVNSLRERGVSLVEIKLTPMSPFTGYKGSDLPLPAEARLMCIARGEAALFDLQDTRLQVGDVLFVLCRDIKSVRHAFYLER
jgi:Trk K+ transport system NAD-binding subunit